VEKIMIYNILIVIILIVIGIRIIIDKQTGMWGNTFDLSKDNLYIYNGGFFILMGLIFLFYVWKNRKNN